MPTAHRTPVPLAVAVAGAIALVLPLQASADECASNGPHAFLSTPHGNTAVARNVRFQIGLVPSCGGVEDGPAHEFRLTDHAGRVVDSAVEQRVSYPDCRPAPCLLVTLIPRELLPSGHSVHLQLRRPVSDAALSDWEQLASFRVADRVDGDAPRFEGIESARPVVIHGSEPISPCESVPAWELEIQFRFRLAHDGPTDPDELVYALEHQRPGADTWELAAEFRPQASDERGFGRFAWRDRSGWAQTRAYRIRVHDASGHVTLGARTATVTAPARPETPPSAPASTSQPKPAGCRACSVGSINSPQRAPWTGLLIAVCAWALRRSTTRAD